VQGVRDILPDRPVRQLPAGVRAPQGARVAKRQHELLGEQGHAVAALIDRRHQAGGRRRAVEHAADERLELGRPERVERHDGRPRAGRPRRHEAGAHREQDEHTLGRGLADEALEQRERRRVGPVDVLEDEHGGGGVARLEQDVCDGAEQAALLLLGRHLDRRLCRRRAG
jgi:hypothetical protein